MLPPSVDPDGSKTGPFLYEHAGSASIVATASIIATGVTTFAANGEVLLTFNARPG
jgi:hypothetical protein